MNENSKKIIVFVTMIIFIVVYYSLYKYTSPDQYNVDNIDEFYTVEESENGAYYGKIINRYYTGTGLFIHISNEHYAGEFFESKRHGNGEFYFSNGDIFKGTWKNDNMDSGTYTFSDGSVFIGSFNDNKFYKGVFKLNIDDNTSDYISYIADIDDGNVSAINMVQKNNTKYNGRINGYAEITYPSGNKYIGNVSNCIRDGKGIFKWIYNGEVIASYSGNWVNGIMDGLGEYYYTSDKYPYINGTFNKGKLNGKATYYKSENKSFKTSWNNGICINNNF